MNLTIDTQGFRFDGKEKLDLKQCANQIEPMYESKKKYRKLLEEFQEEINELQNMMYAHDRYSMLLIFQAMDAAGKDGTIQKVMSGINPHGVSVNAFKKPSDEELDHDFLWRTTKVLPRRGTIGIFNRSYYEEVLVVKVHPKILTNYQQLPADLVEDPDKVWPQRYEDIRNFETYLSRNGTKVVKFFLNLSKDEQKDRFLARIDTQEKNWKFSEADVKERGYWDEYQNAYEDAINATASKEAPWYVIPADNKKNMRLIVAQVILEQLHEMKMHYPVVSDERRAELQEIRKQLADS
ncbi:MAG: polyphosphate kinase 2 family protein [Bacteroidota bacterium]